MQSLSYFFRQLKLAIQQNNESDFKLLWHPESYVRNLVGAGGFSGDAIFTQAINGKWSLEAKLETLEELKNPDALLIAVEVRTALEKDSKEQLFLLLQKEPHSEQFIIIAAAEKHSELYELWLRLAENTRNPSTKLEDNSDDCLPILSIEDQALSLVNSINQALSKGDENAFALCCFEKGFYHNLAGASGWSLKELYTLCKAKFGLLKPALEYAALFEQPEAVLLPCSLLRPTLQATEEEDFALLCMQSTSGLKVLGAAGNWTDLRHLYLSYQRAEGQ